MKIQSLFRQLTTIAWFAILASCGGGGGGTGTVENIAGIGGTGIKTSGAITAFGSIFVNGIEFETGSATISLDDNPGAENQLRLGMIVVVNGTLDDGGTTGTANSVSFNDEIQGPIANIDTDADGLAKTLTILGMQVRVDANTVFDEVSFDTLTVNIVVEISGFVDGSGIIHATRVEKKEDFIDNSSEIELKGFVSELTGTNFTMGDFNIDFSSANLSGLPGGVVSNGLHVEVKGTGALGSTTISASRVKQEDNLFENDEEEASLEGIISNFIDNSHFRVAGQLVDASRATLEPIGLTLGNDIEIEVDGPIINGVLEAVSVEADDDDA